jgi:hypothetical protein
VLFRRYILAVPGDAWWPDFCEWVSAYVYFDRDTGLVRYRPRDASVFHWAEDPLRAAKEWNAASANQPVQILGGRSLGGIVLIDGCRVLWKSVKLALGVVGGDMNKALPLPDRLTDEEVVAWYGLGYALYRKARAAARAEAEKAKFEEAVRRYEARIERKLTAHEKKIAKAGLKALS